MEAQKWDADTRAEFYSLLNQASRVNELGHVGHAPGEHAYEAAGRRLIASCDVLFALWDGQETGGRGGTAETLREAAARGKPSVSIPTDQQTCRPGITSGPANRTSFFRKSISEPRYHPAVRARR